MLNKRKFPRGKSLITSTLLVMVAFSACNQRLHTSNSETVADSSYRDLYVDTWVATDAVGRDMPSFEEVGPLKDDRRRVVGMFYVTWHTQNFANLEQPYRADVTRILEADPTARFQANHPLWHNDAPHYHWGEPEMGYYLSQDEYVIRKDMSMLADAGVDVLIVDATNAVRYWEEWDVTFRVMREMIAEGNKVPRFCFWAFNGPVITVVQDLFDNIYKQEKYKDLWYYWDGKPLLLYNGSPDSDSHQVGIKHPNPHYDPDSKTDPNHPHYLDPDYTEEFYKDYTQEVKTYFTLRTMWWGEYEWRGKHVLDAEDYWCFGYDIHDPRIKDMSPVDLAATHNGVVEQFAVTPAQHAHTIVGRSWTRENGEPELNEFDLPKPTYIPSLGKVVDNPAAYGLYFQERWDEALQVDPPFLYINDWNEWTAGKFPTGKAPGSDLPGPTTFLNRESPYYFIDQYNAEFSRAIQPMKDGFTDNYYMQMAQNIRRYKGVRPIPEQKGLTPIEVDGKFNDWSEVTNEFRDTRGDIFHRNAVGYSGINYTNNSGRNDIITSKAAVDETCVYFYVKTAGAMTSHTDKNWMLLLIDADNNPETGWYGYDFLINKDVLDENATTLMKYDESEPEGAWKEVAKLDYRYTHSELELAIPRNLLGLENSHFVFDFKWSDNPAALKDPISFCTDGDTAPNRRFNYRFIWSK